jgi:hypothetical protein
MFYDVGLSVVLQLDWPTVRGGVVFIALGPSVYVL